MKELIVKTSQPEKKESAFKNWINKEVVKKTSQEIQVAIQNINNKKLISSPLPKNKNSKNEIYIFEFKKFEQVASSLEPLELKARVKAIADSLKSHLPEEFELAASILNDVILNKNLKGFELWPISEFISQKGLDYPETSIGLMTEMTQLFTSEFAVRPFIKKDPEYMLAQLKKLTRHQNPHVRRWVSEGTRPRLPWGEKIDAFYKNPTWTLPLLEDLKYDDELYVRKSVANHINDLSFIDAKLVINLLKTWLKKAPKNQSEKIEWIKRHALRTLIKKGHEEALELMGVSTKAEYKIKNFKLLNNNKNSTLHAPQKFKVGQYLDFEFSILSKSKSPQAFIVDYLVFFNKANGKQQPKVFKLKTLRLSSGEEIKIVKKHSLRQVTTRKFYKGLHKIALKVNGKESQAIEWELLI